MRNFHAVFLASTIRSLRVNSRINFKYDHPSLPAAQASIPISDRSWMYGDGLFETLRIHEGHPFRWNDHWTRWTVGAQLIRLPVPYSQAVVRSALSTVIESNHVSHGVARLHLSRGPGPRGYSIRGAQSPTIVISAVPDDHPAEAFSLSLHRSSVRIPFGDPLGRFKTASKLPIILAQIEAEEAGASAALLTDTEDRMATSSRGNLFWITKSNTVATPPLSSGALDGVTRSVVIEICRELNVSVQELRLPPEALFQQDGVFVTSSGFGLAPLTAFNEKSLPSSPLLNRLQAEYQLHLARGA